MEASKEVANFISTISFLKKAGDSHVNSQKYPQAIQYYTNALSYINKLTQEHRIEVRTGSKWLYIIGFADCI